MTCSWMIGFFLCTVSLVYATCWRLCNNLRDVRLIVPFPACSLQIVVLILGMQWTLFVSIACAR